MLDSIHYWDSFLTEDELSKLFDEMERSKWEFVAGERADLVQEPLRTFWYKDLITSEFIENLFRTKVEQYIGKEVESLRLYLNGQSHGQTAWTHSDVSEKRVGEFGSIVCYVHTDWRPVYGGHLIFVDESETAVTHSVFPKFNSAVLFNSRLKHCALEPTVYCTKQRLSIAYKFKVV